MLLEDHILLFLLHNVMSTLQSASVSVFFSFSLSLSLFSSGWTYPGKRRSFRTDRSYIDELCLFSREVPVLYYYYFLFIFFADPGAVISVAVAGRQRCSSAKCSSCLPLLPFSLTRCREQESRPRFLTNEDASPMENT